MDIVKHNFNFKTPLKKRTKTTEIILHCTASKEGQDVSIESIHKYHRDSRGWAGIGYNYVIDLKGNVHEGRPQDYAGAHATNHNSISIGISYVGGIDSKGKAKDTRTQAQKEAMYKLVHELLNKYHLKIDNVHCHYEFANKACPSFKIETFKQEYKQYFKQ